MARFEMSKWDRMQPGPTTWMADGVRQDWSVPLFLGAGQGIAGDQRRKIEWGFLLGLKRKEQHIGFLNRLNQELALPALLRSVSLNPQIRTLGINDVAPSVLIFFLIFFIPPRFPLLLDLPQ